MRKLYNDIIYFVQNHVKPVAPSNSYPSSLILSNPSPSSMLQKPQNQSHGFYQSHSNQAPQYQTVGSFDSVIEESNSISRTKLFGVPLQSKKRLHSDYASNATNMEMSKARFVLDKDDLGLNLMPPSAC